MTRNERVYLTLSAELQTRIDIAYAQAKRRRKTYSRSEFMQSLIRDALDQRDDLVGSKTLFANRVGDRVIAKMDNLFVILLAIFHLLGARSNAPDTLKNDSFRWAVENSTALESRVAELRQSIAKRDQARPDDASSLNENETR